MNRNESGSLRETVPVMANAELAKQHIRARARIKATNFYIFFSPSIFVNLFLIELFHRIQ